MNRWLLLLCILTSLGTGCDEGPIVGPVNRPDGPPPSASAPTASTREDAIPVEGMVCESCEKFIKETLELNDGVRQAQASHANRVVQVQYDPALVTPEKMVEWINKTQYKAFMPGTILPPTSPASAPASAPGKGMH